eukprot:1139880-Pelagomonas_calceolata.AAC.1
MDTSKDPVLREFAPEVEKRKGKKKNRTTEEILPASIKEEETKWLRRAVSPLHHKATEQTGLVRIWSVTGSTRHQSLAVRCVFVFSSVSLQGQISRWNCRNKCADAIAEHQAIQGDDTSADTTFPRINRVDNPSHDTTWLAFEEAACSHASTLERPNSPAPNFKHNSNLRDALRTHMHSKHRLGNANAETGCSPYYQSLLPTVRKKKRKTTQAVKTPCDSPHQFRKRGYLGLRHRVSPSPRETRKKSMGIRRVTSSSPCLILAVRVERSLLKSASGANKFIS